MIAYADKLITFPEGGRFVAVLRGYKIEDGRQSGAHVVAMGRTERGAIANFWRLWNNFCLERYGGKVTLKFNERGTI